MGEVEMAARAVLADGVQTPESDATLADAECRKHALPEVPTPRDADRQPKKAKVELIDDEMREKKLSDIGFKPLKVDEADKADDDKADEAEDVSVYLLICHIWGGFAQHVSVQICSNNVILEVENVPNENWQNAIIFNGVVVTICGGDAAQEDTSRIPISERSNVKSTYLGPTKVVMEDVFPMAYKWLEKKPNYKLHESTCIHFMLDFIKQLFGKNAEEPLSKARAELRRLSKLVLLFA